MAVKTSLKLIAEEIGTAIRGYAARCGWDQDDIAITGTFDPTTDRITVYLASDRRVDERQWYKDVLGLLRQQFRDSPGLVSRIGIIVKNVESLDSAYHDLLVADDEIDLTEYLD